MVMEVSVNSMVLIISLYLSASHQHVVHLKFTQCDMLVIPQLSWKEKNLILKNYAYIYVAI